MCACVCAGMLHSVSAHSLTLTFASIPSSFYPLRGSHIDSDTECEIHTHTNQNKKGKTGKSNWEWVEKASVLRIQRQVSVCVCCCNIGLLLMLARLPARGVGLLSFLCTYVRCVCEAFTFTSSVFVPHHIHTRYTEYSTHPPKTPVLVVSDHAYFNLASLFAASFRAFSHTLFHSFRLRFIFVSSIWVCKHLVLAAAGATGIVVGATATSLTLHSS